MPKLKTYNIFISHAWSHNDDYERLVNLLDKAPLLKWRNYSIPRDEPVLNPSAIIARRWRLMKEIDQQMSPSSCVLIVCGMYVAQRFWCKEEIEIAQKYTKPIIGIIPRGNQRVPRVVQDAAVKIVGWHTNSIVEAIRKFSV